MNSTFERICRQMHKSLHDPDARGVRVGNEIYYIKVARNGCRYITQGGRTFIQQDPNRWGKWANQAQTGGRVTRIKRPGKAWGTITDTEIVDPLDGA